MALVEVKVPDIGDFKDVEIIELLVKPGDTIKAEQSLVTVESDKASMEIPSSHAGVVKELKVKLGDKISEGSLLLMLESSSDAVRPEPVEGLRAHGAGASTGSARTGEGADRPDKTAPQSEPDTANQKVAPSELAAPPSSASPASVISPSPTPAPAPAAAERTVPTAALPAHEPTAPRGQLPHASPTIRKLARELGVPLEELKGSGPKGRITHDDVHGFVKAVMAGEARTQAQAAKGGAAGSAGNFPGLPAWPQVDFAKFGPVERRDLSRIKKLSGAALHRNWVMIPHVTNHDNADVTELEALRVQLNKENEKSGVKVTMLAFVIKAVVAALKKFPDFNASLDGDALVLKKYFHIGFAADTPNGLVVPVLKDADQKGVLQISKEMSELAAKARDGKLGPSDMTGGCFSISSLGGIGGRYFSPIINAPEVAILGLSRSVMEPVWDATVNGGAFQPRLMLPLSLSYDHRVIDGAAAARFNTYLAQVLSDFRRVLL